MGAKEEGIKLKDLGNKAFAAHDWPTAIDYYTKAIELDNSQPTYYSNRAQVGSSSELTVYVMATALPHGLCYSCD